MSLTNLTNIDEIKNNSKFNSLRVYDLYVDGEIHGGGQGVEEINYSRVDPSNSKENVYGLTYDYGSFPEVLLDKSDEDSIILKSTAYTQIRMINDEIDIHSFKPEGFEDEGAQIVITEVDGIDMTNRRNNGTEEDVDISNIHIKPNNTIELSSRSFLDEISRVNIKDNEIFFESLPDVDDTTVGSFMKITPINFNLDVVDVKESNIFVDTESINLFSSPDKDVDTVGSAVVIYNNNIEIGCLDIDQSGNISMTSDDVMINVSTLNTETSIDVQDNNILFSSEDATYNNSMLFRPNAITTSITEGTDNLVFHEMNDGGIVSFVQDTSNNTNSISDLPGKHTQVVYDSSSEAQVNVSYDPDNVLSNIKIASNILEGGGEMRVGIIPDHNNTIGGFIGYLSDSDIRRGYAATQSGHYISGLKQKTDIPDANRLVYINSLTEEIGFGDPPSGVKNIALVGVGLHQFITGGEGDLSYRGMSSPLGTLALTSTLTDIQVDTALDYQVSNSVTNKVSISKITNASETSTISCLSGVTDDVNIEADVCKIDVTDDIIMDAADDINITSGNNISLNATDIITLLGSEVFIPSLPDISTNVLLNYNTSNGKISRSAFTPYTPPPIIANVTTTPSFTSPNTVSTVTIPANTIGTIGEGFRIVAYGSCISGSNSKIINILFNGTPVTNNLSTSATATRWSITANCVYTTGAANSATLKCVGQCAQQTSTNGLTTFNDYNHGLLNLTNAITCTVRFASGDGEITCEYIKVNVI